MIWTVGGTNAPKNRPDPHGSAFFLPVNACFMQAKVHPAGNSRPAPQRTPAGNSRRLLQCGKPGITASGKPMKTRGNTSKGAGMNTAPMYGRPKLTSGSSGSCGCCGEWYGKEQAKHREEKQWRRDYLDEMAPETEPEPGYDSYPEVGYAFPEYVADIPRVNFIPT